MSRDPGLIVIKIGTHVITKPSGLPDPSLIASISQQVVALKAVGYSVVLVSSGAVASGQNIFQGGEIKDPIQRRQVLSALGQVDLMMRYREQMAKGGIQCAQVLVTKEDFKDRTHYLNMKNCIQALIGNGIVPIVNENDVVSITELMFTDNDELAGLVSTMVNASKLIILTSVDGIFDRDPSDPAAQLIRVFNHHRVVEGGFVAGKKSAFGRGGILTKCQTAVKISGMGIPVHIANGRTEGILAALLEGAEQPPGTFFPAGKSTSSIKKYVAQATETNGKLTINGGAEAALRSTTAKSLLPVGVTQVVGQFKKGDVVRIEGEHGQEIGLGLARVDSEKARSVMGINGEKPLIHYDYLYLH
ncbi:MAG: glutamate 5-kinase [Bacteroidota bacterium]